jgi:hypothetical protein
MKDQIQKDIERLAKRCLKAGVIPQIVCNTLAQAMQDEWFRTLVEAEGLVKRKYANDNDKHDYYTYGHNHIRDAIVDKNT